MADNASSLKINELTGKKRSLEFTGRALPYRPFKLKGSMRSEITYYPGNPIGTVQMLGASESDTTLQGTWKDRFLRAQNDQGEGVEPSGEVEFADESGYKKLADVDSIVNAVDDFRMQGQLVEVTWDTKVRRGVIKDFTQTWQRHEVCEWEITFGWISRGEDAMPVNFAQPNLLSAVQASIGDILTAIDTYAFLATARPSPQMALPVQAAWFKSVTSDSVALTSNAYKDAIALEDSFAVAVTAHVLTLHEARTAIDDAAAAQASGTVSSADSARRMLATFETLKDTAAALSATVQGRPSPAMLAQFFVAATSTGGTEGTGGASGGSADFGSTLEAANWARSVKRACQQLRAIAAEQGFQIAQTLDEQEILGVFNARQDTDLRDVSARYYGTPDEWRRLMTYNGLLHSKLNVGDEIRVPRFRTGGRQP